MLKLASPEIQQEFVKNNGLNLQYAHDDLKNNEDVVLEAVKQNGDALQFASSRFQPNAFLGQKGATSCSLESLTHSLDLLPRP